MWQRNDFCQIRFLYIYCIFQCTSTYPTWMTKIHLPDVNCISRQSCALLIQLTSGMWILVIFTGFSVNMCQNNHTKALCRINEYIREHNLHLKCMTTIVQVSCSAVFVGQYRMLCRLYATVFDHGPRDPQFDPWLHQYKMHPILSQNFFCL